MHGRAVGEGCSEGDKSRLAFLDGVMELMQAHRAEVVSLGDGTTVKLAPHQPVEETFQAAPLRDGQKPPATKKPNNDTMNGDDYDPDVLFASAD